MPKPALSWSRESTQALIEVYKNRTCLYNTKSPDYHNREKNRDALEEMVAVVSKFHPEVTMDDCKKKYQGLRGQFSWEYARFVGSQSSGAGVEDIAQPKLWCYELLLFLRDSVKCKKGQFFGMAQLEAQESEEMVVEYLDEDEEILQQSEMLEEEYLEVNKLPKTKRKISVTSTLSPEPGCSIPKRLFTKSSRSREESPTIENAFMTSVTTYLERKEPKEKSSDTAFANFISSRLQNIKAKYKKKLEQEIVQLIFHYENMDSDSE